MLTKEKVNFIALKALKWWPKKSSIRKNATNRVILSQIARLQHNRVITKLLQKNIGKIMIFSVFKEIWQ